MKYKSLSSSLCNFLQSPLTLSLSEQNIFLSTLFLNILSLYSSSIVRNGFSHPCKMIQKIIVLYILIFTFFDNIWEDKRFWTKWIKAFPELNLLLVSSWTQFWFVKVVHRYSVIHPLSLYTYKTLEAIVSVIWLHFLQSRGFETQSVHESFVVKKHHRKVCFYSLISKTPFNHYHHSELVF